MNSWRINRRNESGSALVYILIAIALLAALTITFMQPSSQQTSTQNTFKTLTEVESQASMIRSALQECVLSYPKGDRCISDAAAFPYCTSSGVTESDVRTNYPINPDSDFYTSATPGKSGNDLVRSLRCPGNNPGGANHADHEPVFTGSEGKFLPPPPDLFDDWEYYNGEDGIFFWTKTDKTDAFLLTALAKLDDKYAECEADIIDTTDAPAGAKDLDSNGAYECPANNVCFRVWLLRSPTAVFYGDADGDETTSAPPAKQDCSTND